MIANRRRIFLVVISVSTGSVLALMLWIARYGKMKPQDIGNIIVNFAFSLALVIGIAIFLGRRNKAGKQD